LLQEHRDQRVSVLVVWERVGSTKAAPAATRPPPSSMLARISDARAAQFWDPADLTSTAIWNTAQRSPGWPTSDLGNPARVIWDTVLVFAPSARWEADPPAPVYVGGNVVDVVSDVGKQLY
jgi:hypothetical protein